MHEPTLQAQGMSADRSLQLVQVALKYGFRLSALLVGAVYFITAIGKGTQVDRTAIVIESILPVHEQVSQGMVVVLIAIELALAGMLISGYRLKLSSFVSLLLGALFFIWHLLVWLDPGAIDCGCGAPLMVKKLIGDFGSGVSLAGGVFVLSGVALFGCFQNDLYQSCSS